jgi:hypothetical protein
MHESFEIELFLFSFFFRKFFGNFLCYPQETLWKSLHYLQETSLENSVPSAEPSF